MKKLLTQDENHALECVHKVNCYDQATSLESHCHMTYEIIYVLEGEASAIIEGKSYHISKGSLLLLTPTTYHSITVSANMIYDRVYLLFNSSSISDTLKDEFTNQYQNSCVLYLPDEKFCFKSIKRICQGDFQNKYRSILRDFLNCIIFDLLAHQEQVKTSSPKTDMLVTQMIHYIDENVAKDIRLDDLAKHINISVSSACHKFKSNMNITIMQYIIQKKIICSIELMRDGKTASEAALLVGYSNYVNFYNEFKKITGTTPSKYNLHFETKDNIE